MANQDVIVCHRYESHIIVSVTLNSMFLISPSCQGEAIPERQNDLSETATCRISFALCSALYQTGLFNPARCCYMYSFKFMPKLVAFSEFQLS